MGSVCRNGVEKEMERRRDALLMCWGGVVEEDCGRGGVEFE